MISFVLSFVAGILCVQQLAKLPEPLWLLLGILLTGIMAWLRYWKIVLFFAGVLWAVFFAALRLDDRLPEELAGKDINLQGQVIELPESKSNSIRFDFKVGQALPGVPRKVRLTWYYPDSTVKAGQEWRFTVRLKPPHGQFNPGGFDYERWLFVEGFGATGYVRTTPAPQLLAGGNGLSGLDAWRQGIADRLDQIHVSPDSLSMIKALTIGYGGSLTPQQWEVFRKTGTTHLMVISGSHIGLVSGLVYLLVLKLWARLGVLAWSPQKAAAVSAMAIAMVYAGLTGFSVPAQRAALMLTIVMVAILGQRNPGSFHTLTLALFVVLLVDPLVVLLPGFWLSFTAVCLIIFSLDGRLKSPGFFLGAAKINWVTSIGLSPFLLFFFHQVSLISPFVNFITAPIVGLIIVPLALMATFVLFISTSFAEKLFVPVDIALQGLGWILTQLAGLPLAAISHDKPSGWALGLTLPAVILLFAPKGMPNRWLGLVLLFPLVFTESERVMLGTAKLTLLDVGQGLSAVVQTANHTLVYDAGAKFSSTSDSGQSVILPFLQGQGITQVDTLVVSHGDNDHIGGAATLLNGINTVTLLTSVPQQLDGYRPIRCKAGQSWRWDQVRFTVLSPEPGQLVSDNNNSCVLQVRALHGSALLPGDIEAEAESKLLEAYGGQLKSDVLIAPHHGSQTSSTPSFLKTVNPSLILVPAGYCNPFGHPHQDVLNRYRDFHVKWFNSADDGAIQVTMGNPIKVESWREKEGKYWNDQKDE